MNIRASLSKLEQFKHSSAFSNIKYSCAVLFTTDKCIDYLSFQIYFIIDHQCKTQVEFFDLPEKDRISISTELPTGC